MQNRPVSEDDVRLSRDKMYSEVSCVRVAGASLRRTCHIKTPDPGPPRITLIKVELS